ncbi:hypothetical protein PFICI_12138 [Pestalotiopsis fici W106-1]|uniref:Uncharacterized protein n=1 Tax=Pestalotiopsis fici (strain W106-1 / CGMCC3.15140) TaxID=1229662 RepID=W3WV85_PESFW|nr:uncharacterized protein PFICI_12138 [Pestalotiopsis fici W106-1]ETS76751.1 hypothetical protein PFICI_12138 [Pestalotiopsis fici W106-1]
MFLQLLHLAQAVLAGYGAQQSYIAITNLQKYEDTSKKLAKYSNEAERQLHTTRTTQASGALAIAASLLAALYLLFKGGSGGALFRLIASPVVGVAIFLARNHVQGFWAGGKRVPLPKMEDYNEAQRRTDELLKVLDWLVLSWAATSLVAVFKGY